MTRKALCIGINDCPGNQNDLSGCVNDWATELTVTKPLDGQATMANMVATIGATIPDGASGDTVVITCYAPKTPREGKPANHDARFKEAVQYALGAIRPGRRATDVFDGYYRILARHGYENFTLYGPAHGTGHAEVEGLWLARQADFAIQPNMLFNIDIWLSDGTFGMRYEDGVLVTGDGIRELTSWRREVIEL